MSSQIQCPNCGGYKTATRKIAFVDATTRKSVSSEGNAVLVSLCTGITVGFLMWLIMALLFPGSLSKENLENNVVLLLFPPALAFFITFLVNVRRVEKNSALAINVYKSECSLCGKIWQWDEGSPRQNIQVRPDLIQKGAKKLEEDAATAAWYWQQQQDAKKKR